jgi:two-component system, NarL family, response regulator DesR
VIEILLAQRGSLTRGALASVLAAESDLAVSAEAATQQDALHLAAAGNCDLAVVDAALPGEIIIGELCTTLIQTAPNISVLVIADRSAAVGLASFIATLHPRLGLVATEASPTALIEGVRRLIGGRPVLDVELALAALTAQSNPLTGRERVVLRHALGGAPVCDIAASLFLSRGTVRNYLSRAVAKTGARTRIEAMRIAQDSGWI